jgi:hypothetical protein
MKNECDSMAGRVTDFVDDNPAGSRLEASTRLTDARFHDAAFSNALSPGQSM